MKTIRTLFILMSLLIHYSANAAYITTCDDVIYQACPGSDDDSNYTTINNNLKSTPTCDTIIQAPIFGTVEYVGSGGNVFPDSLYHYTTYTNCNITDVFIAVECYLDSAGNIVRDTVEHILHLKFECETPDDLFCCIPLDPTYPLDVLVNDSTFIEGNYDIGTYTITDYLISGPTNGNFLQNGENNPFAYNPNSGFTGLDSFSYQVTYTIVTTDGDTIVICDKQTCYVLIEDCLNTMKDEYCIAPGDTICINPLANDIVEPTINDPILDALELECQNPLPSMDSLTISPQSSAPPLFTDGNCDTAFSSSTIGTFTYTYEVCTDVGACKTDTIIINVINCIDVQIYAHLEGAYDSALNEMSTALNERGILPGQTPTSDITPPTPSGQPYNTAPWNHFGTEGIGWTDANYMADIVDWVLVSFRTGTAKDTEVAKTAALLNKDGSIVFPDDCPLTTCADSLYIVVEHRNHIGIMSPTRIHVVNDTLAYDFRGADSYTNPASSVQKQLPNGAWAMIAGDADPNDNFGYDINGNDKITWETRNGTFNVYTAADMNLDADVNGSDKIIWYINNGTFSAVPR